MAAPHCTECVDCAEHRTPQFADAAAGAGATASREDLQPMRKLDAGRSGSLSRCLGRSGARERACKQRQRLRGCSLWPSATVMGSKLQIREHN